MQKKRMIHFVLLFCLLLTMGLAGCENGEDDAASPAADDGSASPVSDSGDAAAVGQDISATLTMSIIESNKPGMEPLLADFAAEYPNIKIEPEYIADLNAYFSQIPARMSAGNGPDLVFMIMGSASPCGVGRFAEADYLLDLSGESWVSDMYEGIKPNLMYDGKVVAKDFGVAPLADLQYNKDYFEANNLEIPETFGELVELCKQIVALGDGVVPISWGAGDPAVNHNDFASMSGNTVFSKDPDWLQKRLAGETTFAESVEWRKTLEQLVELIDVGAFGPGAAGLNNSQMAAQFGDGKAAMAFMYGGMAGIAMAANSDLSIGQFAFPAEDAADTRCILTGSGGMGINATADENNQAAAKIFLEFWARPEASKKFTDAAMLISGAEAQSGDLPGAYADLSQTFKDGKVIADPTANWPNTSFKTEAGSSIQGLFTGQKTIDEVLADLDTYFEAT